MNLLEKIAREGCLGVRARIPDMKPGDTVRVHNRVKEGDKERIQIFEGIVIRRKGHACEATFTVRKVSYGIGVERIFPFHAPSVAKVEVVSKGQVRRAKLYYLRDLQGKKARVLGLDVSSDEQAVDPSAPV